MIRFTVGDKENPWAELVVECPAAHADRFSPWTVEGDYCLAVSDLRGELLTSRGLYGHLITEVSSPRDLNAAIVNLPDRWTLVKVERSPGIDLETPYQFPHGVCS